MIENITINMFDPSLINTEFLFYHLRFFSTPNARILWMLSELCACHSFAQHR